MASVLSLAGAAGTTLVALILLRAAWHKSTAFWETVGFARDYGLIPERWTAPALRLLAAAEGAAVLLLLVPQARWAGAMIAAALFAGYGAAMLAALRAGRTEIECGCGGPPQVVSRFTVGRNVVLTALAFSVALLPAGPIGVAGAVAAILTGLTFWLSLTLAEALEAHRPHLRRIAERKIKET